MITRQKFIHCTAASTVTATAATIGAPFILQGCYSESVQSYETSVRNTWHPTKTPVANKMLLRQELVA